MQMNEKITRSKLIVYHISTFLKALSDFKTVYKTKEHFENNLSKIHKSFTTLKNVLENLNKMCDVEKETINDIIKYKIGNITLLKHTIYGYISVETGNTDLNEYLIKRRSFDLKMECVKFRNFEMTMCDFCGTIGYELPMNKIMDHNIILSFHDKCIKELSNAF
ncbi:hypothetical protein NCER_100855 [Vairimorpha ceranae BRL01]|uniref:Uncharacterized protein n=1 Tax=Vairimorpha ceranae (strain BRL01) TaxID=578460 RepID=C4V8M3_VAIC1|nr:hypothetical protein NCER_100855 [Vairimorpha ceranae BRL01]